jgi:hypothetical protein
MRAIKIFNTNLFYICVTVDFAFDNYSLTVLIKNNTSSMLPGYPVTRMDLLKRKFECKKQQ